MSRTENISFKVTKIFVSFLPPSQLQRYSKARLAVQSNYCCKIPWLSSRTSLWWFGGSLSVFPPFFFSTSYSELPLLGGIWVVCIGCVYISCTPVLCVKSWDTKFMLYSCITDKCFEKSGITEISWKFKQQQMRSCEGLTGYCVDWHKQEFSIQNPGMCWVGRTHQNH